MALSFNGHSPKKIKFNGKNVAKLIYNGIVVWLAKILTLVTGKPPLTLENSTGENLVDYKIYGESVQEIIISKNLFDKNSIPLDAYVSSGRVMSHTSCKAYVVQVQPNTTYTFTYDNSIETSQARCSINGFADEPVVGSINGVVYYSNNENKKHICTFTTDSSINYIALWLVYKVSDVTSIMLDTAQLEEGSESTPYQPFGKIEPTPETPIEIESVGDKTKNLLDKNTLVIGVYNPAEKPTLGFVTDLRYRSFNKHVKAGTYTLSCSSTINSVRGFTSYDYSKTVIFTPVSNKYSWTFTVTEDCTLYISFRKYDNTNWEDDIDTVQLEEGSKPAPFEPYGYKVPVKVSSPNLFDAHYNTGYGGTFPDITTNNVGMSTEWYEMTEDFKNMTLVRTVNTADATVFGAVYSNDKEAILTRVGAVNNNTLTVGKRTFTPLTVLYKEDYKYIKFYTNKKSPFEELGVFVGNVTEYQPYFEPYTENIYLNEPLRKLDNYADYADFENQKVVRNVEVVDDTGTKTIEESLRGLDTPIEESIELPDILTPKGTNIISIDTKIQPSNMEIKYYKEG